MTRELLGIKWAVESERSSLPLSELVIVLPSKLYQKLRPDSEKFVLYGCDVVECEYLSSSTILVSRKYDLEEWL